MRIIAGTLKRQLIEYPKDNPDLRPTRDMVREAVFMQMHHQLPGSRFLDLFAGVGSIGFEAYSRGAAEVVMIDRDPSYVFKNAKKLNILDKLEVYKNDHARALAILGRRERQFELIYLDPPYATNLVIDALQKIHHFNILAKNGIIIIETDRAIDIPSPFKCIDQRTYGITYIYRVAYE